MVNYFPNKNMDLTLVSKWTDTSPSLPATSQWVLDLCDFFTRPFPPKHFRQP